MNTALAGSNPAPAGSARVGRSSPPSRYSRVLLPDPLCPTIETYSSRPTDRDTPFRMWLAVSPVPSTRCTFCARNSAAGKVDAALGVTVTFLRSRSALSQRNKQLETQTATMICASQERARQHAAPERQR